MTKLTVVDGQSYDVPAGKRLVLALEDSGVDILHRCGGYARCTTCRVEFEAGEPDKMTEAEANRLAQGELLGDVRLSCQITCEDDMTLKPVYRLSEMEDMDDPGPRPEDNITPEPKWQDTADVLKGGG